MTLRIIEPESSGKAFFGYERIQENSLLWIYIILSFLAIDASVKAPAVRF